MCTVVTRWRQLAQPIASSLFALVLLAPAAWAQVVRPQQLSTGLDHPWSLAFLPEGRMLVTERPGRLRAVEADGLDQKGCGNGQTFPRSHGTGDALSLVFAPSRVPEMEAERAIEQGGEDVGQKLNYNV